MMLCSLRLPISLVVDRVLDGKCAFSVPWEVSKDTGSWLLRGIDGRFKLELTTVVVTTGPLIEEILENINEFEIHILFA